jgi:hypothetical protein
VNQFSSVLSKGVLGRVVGRLQDRAWDVLARFAVAALLVAIWSTVLGVGALRAPRLLAATVQQHLTPPTDPTPTPPARPALRPVFERSPEPEVPVILAA